MRKAKQAETIDAEMRKTLEAAETSTNVPVTEETTTQTGLRRSKRFAPLLLFPLVLGLLGGAVAAGEAGARETTALPNVETTTLSLPFLLMEEEEEGTTVNYETIKF